MKVRHCPAAVNRIRPDPSVRMPADMSALFSIDADRSMTSSSVVLNVLGSFLGLASLLAGNLSVQAHHVPGDDHTGVTLTMEAPTKSRSDNGGIRAMYPTRSEAEKAAPLFGCKGAHPMGDQWMPCASHPMGGHAEH